MKKTDTPQPGSNQATEDRIRKAGLFGRINKVNAGLELKKRSLNTI